MIGFVSLHLVSGRRRGFGAFDQVSVRRLLDLGCGHAADDGCEFGFGHVDEVGHVCHSVDMSALLTFIHLASVRAGDQPGFAGEDVVCLRHLGRLTCDGRDRRTG